MAGAKARLSIDVNLDAGTDGPERFAKLLRYMADNGWQEEVREVLAQLEAEAQKRGIEWPVLQL